MNLLFHKQGWNDYLEWQQLDKAMLKRLNKLIQEIQRSPYEGIGKPEPLKFQYSGYWSRKINDEHRIIYKIEEIKGSDVLIIVQCRYHYTD